MDLGSLKENKSIGVLKVKKNRKAQNNLALE